MSDLNKLLEEGLYCIGCGAKIQIDDESKIGYTPETTLLKEFENNDDLNVLCQRCFRLRNYNEIQPIELSDDDFEKIIKEISAENALIVLVLDVFDVYGTLMAGITRIVGKNNQILLVGNKIDLIPKSVKRTKLADWLRRQSEQFGIRPIDVELVSSIKNINIDQLLSKIDKHRDDKNVYIVGTTNVGKSTLLNSIINSISDAKNVVTTSRFAGTTLDKIIIPFDEQSALIDTPGLINRGQIIHNLNENQLKQIAPIVEVKPRTYQLNAGQSVFIGGLGRFDLLNADDKIGITFYFANQLDLHRTKTENANDFYQKHAGIDLLPAASEKLVEHQFKISESTDIAISGLGWIHLHNSALVNIAFEKSVEVGLRDSMIGN